MSRSEVSDMRAHFRQQIQKFPIGRKLMVGTMMSRKTLRNEPTKWASVFPRHEQYKNIFVRDPLLLNTLHYADYEGKDVVLSLKKAIHLCGDALDAIQLDMMWPEPRAVASLASSYPDISFILQVGDIALNNEGNDPVAVARKIKKYGESITCVLLDRSGGLGKFLDATELVKYIEALTKSRSSVAVAVAGGIGPYTLDLIEPILMTYPDVSFDAQSQMRPSGSAMDPIDWDLAKKYVERALFMSHRISKHPHVK